MKVKVCTSKSKGLIEIQKSQEPFRTVGIQLYLDSIPRFIHIGFYKYEIYIGRNLNIT